MKVDWGVNHKSVENFDDLVLVDRSLLHGDVVAMLSDPYGQTGTIVDVGMFEVRR